MQKPIFEIKEIQNKSIEKDILKAQKDLSKFFGLSFSLPRVFIIKDQRQMNILYQRILDRNSVGSCDGDNIFISSQLLKDDYDRFQKILVHEYAHMAIREFCDILKVKPAWIREGLSCYLANQDKKIPPRDRILKIFTSYFNSSDIYIHNVGYFWVKNLIRKYGKKKILKLLQGLYLVKSQKDFNKLFKSIYRVSFTVEKLGRIFCATNKNI